MIITVICSSVQVYEVLVLGFIVAIVVYHVSLVQWNLPNQDRKLLYSGHVLVYLFDLQNNPGPVVLFREVPIE